MLIRTLVLHPLYEVMKDVLAPLHLHLVVLHLFKGKDYALNQQVPLFLGLAVGFQRVLKHKVSKVTVYNLREDL